MSSVCALGVCRVAMLLPSAVRDLRALGGNWLDMSVSEANPDLCWAWLRLRDAAYVCE